MIYCLRDPSRRSVHRRPARVESGTLAWRCLLSFQDAGDLDVRTRQPPAEAVTSALGDCDLSLCTSAPSTGLGPQGQNDVRWCANHYWHMSEIYIQQNGISWLSLAKLPSMYQVPPATGASPSDFLPRLH